MHVIKGQLLVNDQELNAGDALLLEQETQLNICNGKDAEVLVFDLAAQ